MIVVSDTTPLISLMKLSCLELLEKLFGEVIIPEGVYDELTRNQAFHEEAEYIRSSSFIQVLPVKDLNEVIRLRQITGLDQGESEANILASTVHADTLLMDEAQGRQVAESLRIHIMGTVGILLYAYDEKLVTSSDVVNGVDTLERSGRHMGKRLKQYVLDYTG